MSAGKKPLAARAGHGAPSVETITAAIREEQQRIATEESAMVKNEAPIVAARIAIGRHLLALKEAARGAKASWSKCVAQLGMDERVARRLKALGQNKWAENGLIESDLLERLPTDLIKLEALAPLSGQQLRQFLRQHDPKHLERGEVINLAKELQGVTKSPKATTPSSRITARTGRYKKQLLDDIKAWKASGLDCAAREKCLDVLTTTFGEIKNALGDEPVDSAPEPQVDR